MRATLSPAFTGSKMRGMFTLVTECSEQLTEYLKKEHKKNEPVIVELKDLFTRYSNDVIATSAFGLQVNSFKDRENEFYTKGKEAFNLRGIQGLKFFGFQAIPGIMKAFHIQFFSKKVTTFFRSLVQDTVSAREKLAIIRPDMIHLLMQARKGDLKHGVENEDVGFATAQESVVGRRAGMTHLVDDDITAQALLFFIAGFEPTSTMMSFTAYELALNTDVQKKLQQELDEVKQNHPKLTYDVIQNMKYLDMVVSESMRKWSPAISIDRVCVKSYTLTDNEGTSIPFLPGQGLLIPIHSIHHDEKYFPDPETFDPERFSDNNKHNIQPFTYLPFGLGPRNCIGSRFALMEAKAALVHIFTNFNIEICSKTQIPLKLQAAAFNPVSKDGIWLRFKLRD